MPGRKFRLSFLTCVIIALMASGNAQAQYAPIDSSAVSSKIRNGRNLCDVGKGFMYMGAASAISGGVFTIASMLEFSATYNPEYPTMYIGDIFGIGMALIGAAEALIGTPIFLSGKSKLKGCGEPFKYGEEGQKGFGLLLDSGCGFLYADIRATAGYHINSHVFIGGGTGFYASLLKDERIYSVPLYASGLFTMGHGKVAPFAGIDLGGQYYSNNGVWEAGFYGAVSFGIRFRPRASHRSLWVSVVNESFGSLGSFGLRTGYSF